MQLAGLVAQSTLHYQLAESLPDPWIAPDYRELTHQSHLQSLSMASNHVERFESSRPLELAMGLVEEKVLPHAC